jgi:hypothetical protein
VIAAGSSAAGNIADDRRTTATATATATAVALTQIVNGRECPRGQQDTDDDADDYAGPPGENGSPTPRLA